MNWKQYALFAFLFVLVDSVWLQGGYPLHLQTWRNVTNQPTKTLQVDLGAALAFYAVAPLGYKFFVEPLAQKDPTL